MGEHKNNVTEFLARDCLSGEIINCKGTSFPSSLAEKTVDSDRGKLFFIGPGLIDLQINGVNGVDFNDISLNGEGLLSAAKYLLNKGITTFFPTVITNSSANIRKILSSIDKACSEYPILDMCIGGIHLEGPFISDKDGFRGAHNKKYVKAPDWDLFCTFQKASGNRIKIISLSPEWDNAPDFINNCRKAGLIAGIAHSSADGSQIISAANSGARLSTHLGNSVPLMLPRHPNIIWDQLAEDRLIASIVADGYHLPDSFIKVVLKAKRNKTILVSDATHFTGMHPGIYETHIGKEVVLEEGGRLSIKGQNGLLAGAAKTLLDNVQYMINNKLADISEVWHMASATPAGLLGYGSWKPGEKRDRDIVLFDVKDGHIDIRKVFKNGIPIHELHF
ncbi:MAG: hypothetical protein R6U58_15015 [Bacteroidales bacterium]